MQLKQLQQVLNWNGLKFYGHLSEHRFVYVLFHGLLNLQIERKENRKNIRNETQKERKKCQAWQSNFKLEMCFKWLKLELCPCSFELSQKLLKNGLKDIQMLIICFPVQGWDSLILKLFYLCCRLDLFQWKTLEEKIVIVEVGESQPKKPSVLGAFWEL